MLSIQRMGQVKQLIARIAAQHFDYPGIRHQNGFGITGCGLLLL